MKSVHAALFAVALAFASSAFAADTYLIDKAHSEAGFDVRHMLTKVHGKFDDFSGTIQLDPANLTASSVDIDIKTKSIDTGVEQRDNHLRSGDFFDAEKNPDITFKSTKIAATSKKNVFDVTGTFTMRGVTKTITIPVTLNGFVKDPGGKTRAGFEAHTTLNRKDYGINWNKTLDEGGVLVSDDVDVVINIEAVKQAPAAAK